MRHFALLLTVFALAASASGADINVSVQPLSLAPGQSGLLEVDFSSPGAPSLAQDEFGFSITANNAAGLHFDNSPTPAADSSFTSASYIFAGNSLDFTLGSGFNLATAGGGGQSITGGDSTFDGSNTSVTGGLLAFLPVTAAPTAHPGDTFTISLITGSTQFNDNGNPANVFTFVGTPGLVTIASVAVPEPSTCALALIGLASLALLRRRRMIC